MYRYYFLFLLSSLSLIAQQLCGPKNLMGRTLSTFDPSPYDQAIQAAIAAANVPGAAFAVSYQGRLQTVRGYGCSNTAANTPMQSTSLFRIASVSKTFTAIAILQLVQAGKLNLNDPVFTKILTNFQPLTGQTLDPQVAQITVQQLLQHTGGFDRSVNHKYPGGNYGDAVDNANVFATAEGLAEPGTCADTIRAILSQPLDHAPGTVYAYANTGYCILGRVIEKVSGLGYEQYVQQNILKPLGIGRQKLGATMMSDTVNGEVTYYDSVGAPLVQSVFPFITTPVARPYGQRFTETLDSTGGWVANVGDLVRFVDSIDGRHSVPNVTPLLNPATLALFTAYTPASGFTATSYYGLGFNMTVVPDGIRWTKDGGLPGTASYLFHGPKGFSYAIVFNSNPDIDSASPASGDLSSSGLITSIVATLQNLIDNATAPAGPGDLLLTATSTLLTPAITSVVQGATYSAQPGIVPGSFVSIFGSNLGTASRAWWDDEFIAGTLPTEIDHVLVTINGKNAAVAYVSPAQLNVQAPADTTTGTVNVQVTRDGTISTAATAQLATSAPGFFAYTIGSTTYVAAQHAGGATLGDPAVLPGATPAKPGETVQLYGTGFGPTQAGLIPAMVMPLTPLPAVSIGGLPAVVQFAGINQFAGVIQLNVTIPATLAAGNQQITTTFGGATSPSGIVIPVGSK